MEEQLLREGDRYPVAQPRAAYTRNLTPREALCLLLAGQGLTNKKIAGRLGVTETTVKNHITACLKKLGAPDRTAAVVRAIHEGYFRVRGIGKAPPSHCNADERGPSLIL